MKTAAKVMIIISMVFGCWLVFPIVFGILALIKLDEVKKKDDLLVWAILSLFLVNIVAGIIMLCMSDEDLKENNKEKKEEQVSPNNVVEAEAYVVNDDINTKKENYKEFQTSIDKLEKLYELKEKKIISEEEYENLKKDLLKKL